MTPEERREAHLEGIADCLGDVDVTAGTRMRYDAFLKFLSWTEPDVADAIRFGLIEGGPNWDLYINYPEGHPKR